MPDVITLRTLRRDHPDRFYRQDWFEEEPFMDRPLEHVLTVGPLPMPSGVLDFPEVPKQWMGELPTAVQLADLYVRHPDHATWSRYLWCRDTDAQGQRIYVGSNGRGLEIHRHLHLTSRWGVPLWL